jgi:tetratricopeptide (TPR) repeat protein
LKLREKIETYRAELNTEKSPDMREAWRRHTRKYAAAHYRVGRLHQKRGEQAKALEHYRTALRMDPKVFKYYTRIVPAWLGALAGK